MLSSVYRHILAIALLAAAFTAAGAQAVPTVERGAEFTPFVHTTIVSPDWGQTHNLGFTAGVDYTRFIPAIVQPSLDFRFTKANGRTVNESTYLGGLKLHTTVHGLHPYAVVLAGKGIIDFNYFYKGGIKSESSTVYAFGGGADFRVHRSWKVQAEYTLQHWNVDAGALSPSTLGFGIGYAVPFRDHRGVR
jgi:opacity protein-like surface antigen